MEWLIGSRPKTPVKAVLFDFDGTISTLRHGWEAVMEPFMVEMIEGDGPANMAIRETVRQYIDESTGIQTIFQMKWLVEQVQKAGNSPHPAGDPWAYKAEYNRRLMQTVSRRREQLRSRELDPGAFIIRGGRECLEMLRQRGVQLYVASGTDDADVKEEVEVLGLTPYFNQVTGAPAGREDCSKEAVIRGLIDQKGFTGAQLAVVGDGKVEIAIGRENGARTLGVASDEEKLEGVNPVKRARLLRAGADALTGDFINQDVLREFFFGAE